MLTCAIVDIQCSGEYGQCRLFARERPEACCLPSSEKKHSEREIS